MSTEKRNLNISGAGSFPGGIFENVSISGAGKIVGNISCNRFIGSGSSRVIGNIEAKTFCVSGSGRVEGEIKADKIEANGACTIEGDVFGDLLKISGVGKVLGEVKCEKIHISGSVTVEKNIEAEEIKIYGCVKNKGCISAEKVLIDTRGTDRVYSEFNEIGATHVSINNKGSEIGGILMGMICLFKGGNKVVGNIIEGDEIYIENTKVKIVRGNNVKIGPNCEVGEVEYKESIEVDKSAVVKHRNQI